MITNGLQLPNEYPGIDKGYWNTEEGKGLIAFHKLINAVAKEQNCVFFGDCPDSGEKDECLENGVFYCSLPGWLIPFSQADEFEKDWIKNPFNPGDKWAPYIRWGEWKRRADGTTQVMISDYCSGLR